MGDSWSCNSYTFAEFDLKSIHGSPGLGFYRLLIRVDYTTHSKKPGDEVTVTDIGGELKVSGIDKNERFLGYLQRQGVDTSLTTYEHTYTGQLQFEIELDSRRIAAIEDIRHGEDLIFALTLYGIAHCSSDNRGHNVNATLRYRANQSTWIEVLYQMGYRKTMLMEVPILEDKVSQLFPEAAEHLKTAQTHLLKGHFRDAVGSCRDVMESLSTALSDDKYQPPETIKAWFKDMQTMGKEERLRLVRRALRVLTNPAKHADKVSASIEWGPEDARAVIVMAAILLQMAAEGSAGI